MPSKFVAGLIAVAMTLIALPATAQSVERSLPSGAVFRQYSAQCTGGVRIALLWAHGGGGNAIDAESKSGFSQFAQEEALRGRCLTVIYPQGAKQIGENAFTWHAWEWSSPSLTYLQELLAYVRSEIAPDFVVVGGHSAGAMQLSTLVTLFPWLADVNLHYQGGDCLGYNPEDCRAGRGPIPTVIVHGTGETQRTPNPGTSPTREEQDLAAFARWQTVNGAIAPGKDTVYSLSNGRQTKQATLTVVPGVALTGYLLRDGSHEQDMSAMHGPMWDFALQSLNLK